ncbi:MAG: MBL fold metallo-hydrolase [Candidatus Korobacteraceae bacterium]
MESCFSFFSRRMALAHLAIIFALGMTALATVGCSRAEPGALQAAVQELGANEVNSIEYSGAGKWFQFGQFPNPTLPWPAFDVSNFTASLNYQTPAARVEMQRKQIVEPGRLRPTPVEQRPVQLVSGKYAWNMVIPAASAAGSAPTPQPQPASVEERIAEIWTTPHGFLKAATANNATSRSVNGGSEVSFTVDGKYRYVGRINGQNQVERVQTWIDNPILGDTPVEIVYSDYRDFGGVRFPTKIVRSQGGHPVLELTVAKATANPDVKVDIPEQVRNAPPPTVRAEVEKLANGVYYIRGGSHLSIAIDQSDHIVVVEGPQNEARSEVVITKVKETIPNKPIRYLINTHVHFDHSGGLRTYVDEGATIVTHEQNRPYYVQAWEMPRTINPDRLAQSKKNATFETFTDKHVLTDQRRRIEIYPISGNGHNDAFAMVYLPTEGILIEADAYTPPAANAPPPAEPNPFSVNLNENIQKRSLRVRQIAALHGPGVTTMADLRSAIQSRGKSQ